MTTNSSLSLVTAKGTLAVKIGSNQLFSDISKQLASFGDISDLKDDKHLLEHICKLVENAETVTFHKGEEKKDLVIKILTNVFPILNNEQDIKRIKSDIDYICAKKIVKKVSFLKKLGSVAIAILKKSI